MKKQIVIVWIMACMFLVQQGMFSQANDTISIERNGKSELKIITKKEEKEKKDLRISMDYDKDEHEGDDNNETIKNIKTRWLLFSVGLSNLIGNNDVPTINGVTPSDVKVWPSFHLGFDIFQTRFNLINHYVNLKTGLGINWDTYDFENKYTLLDQQSSVIWTTHPESNFVIDAHFNKNQLKTTSIYTPLLLNFETNPSRRKRSFHLNIGGYVGFLISSKMKLVYANKKLEIKDNYNLSKFQYGLSGSIGYGFFNLFFNYSLNDFFQEDENSGYELNAFSVGVQVSPF